MQQSQDQSDPKTELSAFLILTAVVAPLLAIAIVGGYGFMVWISQILTGPPGV
ncbi:periplasmic nitrate reductase, NapE protein [Marinobacterium jannaschii]|uniref:periplasmic nitrate reductase, NapE protein n=1 Tax=Marinobacterium jannaschii TaxID=64970 RepID=UPI000481BF91|nr:periplasmic nitrate reductase, NapE protein [Marinobacterium jannaschii]